MYCSNCGTEVQNSVLYCPKCGTNTAQSGGTAQAEYGQANRASPTGGMPVRGDISQEVEDHLTKSILATVLCCLPLGIAAIIYSTKVKSLLQADDIDAAIVASKQANLLSNLSIGLGAVIVIISFAAGMLGILE